MTIRVRVTIEVDTDLSKGAFKAMLLRNLATIDPFAGENVVYLATEYGIDTTFVAIEDMIEQRGRGRR